MRFKLFPIAAGRKHPPLVNDWPAKATDDEDTISRWTHQFPGCNWGIHCEGLLVLDVDAHKDGAKEALQQLKQLHGSLPRTRVHRTPSGGMHYFYLCPEGVPNSVNKLGAGLDIRSTNGYVLTEDSVVDGKRYKKIVDEPIVPAPDWLAELASRKPSTTSAKAPERDDIDVQLAIKRAEEFLRNSAPAIEGQGGDAHTYVTVCMIRDMGVPKDRALDLLQQDWNPRCEPPWESEDLLIKIENAYKYAQNEHGANSVEAWFDVIQDSSPSINNERNGKVDTEMYGPDDVQLSEVLSTDYLIKGWIDRSKQVMLFGKWGGGKTFLTLDMAAHLSAGREWFGTRVKQAGTLFAGYEGEVGLKKRLLAIRREYPDFDMTRFKVLPMRWPLAARGSGAKLVGQERLEKALNAYKQELGEYPALLVIDPLRNALGGSDSDPDLTAPYLAYLQHITKMTGCATLTLHHPGHVDADRGRGDSGIEAHMDAVIKLDGKLRTVEATKQRDDAKSILNYRLDVVHLGTDADGDTISTCVVRPVVANPCDPQLTDVEESMLEAIMARANSKGIVAKRKARDALGDDWTPAEKSAIIQALEDKQALVETETGYRAGEGPGEMFQ